MRASWSGVNVVGQCARDGASPACAQAASSGAAQGETAKANRLVVPVLSSLPPADSLRKDRRGGEVVRRAPHTREQIRGFSPG